MSPRYLLLPVLALLLLSCRSKPPPRDRRTIALHQCHLTGSGGQVVSAMCGTLPLPEDRTKPEGRQIDVSFAVVEATGRTTAPDALFFLAGGPGQSALDVYPTVAGSFSNVNLTHDIVVVDQRGTGSSNMLSCDETEVEGTITDPQEEATVAGRCRRDLESRADLTQYTTAIAMDDLDQIREKLGYDAVDLYGASYGTRAALVYLRRHESRVRSVVLDGVDPPDWPLSSTFGRDGQRAMDGIFARCAANHDCNAAFPDLSASLTKLLSAHTEPVSITVAHPTTATPTKVVVSRDTLASTLHALSYASETAALIPLLVHFGAATGELEPLAAQSLIMADSMKVAVGMHFAVVCSEDAPFLDPAGIAEDGATSYLGSAAARRYIEACKAWPRADVSADRVPVASNVPVLLLSGELDPVTPPANAARAARTLPNSLQLTLMGEAHGALLRGCTRRIVSDFIDRASVEGLATGCLNNTRPMRFFTSFAGPQP